MTRPTDSRLLVLDPEDNVLVVRAPIARGDSILIEGEVITLATGVALGHKLARRPVAAGEAIVKYGAIIGTATAPIALGDYVHTHNVRSNYTATHSLEAAAAEHAAAGEGKP